MKQITKLLGIIAFFAVIGFSCIVIGCSGKKNTEQKTEKEQTSMTLEIAKPQADESETIGKGDRNRGERGDRGERGERGEIGGRGERGERGERGDRSGRGERGARRNRSQTQGWSIGDIGPNGGYVYYVDGNEFYEAFPPHSAIGVNDALPSGWVTPDIEDLTLIHEGIQNGGIADYETFYYISVTKSGDKNYYMKMNTGEKVLNAAQGRKIGVRAFDPSLEQGNAIMAASAFTKSAATAAASPAAGNTASPAANTANTAATTETAKPAASAPKYQIGDTGPNGGIVFFISNGRNIEITKPGKEITQSELHRIGKEHNAMIQEYYNDKDNPFIKAAEKAKAEYDADKTAENMAKLNAANQAKYDNVPEYPYPYPAGWRTPTMPELIIVYDVLVKTGKVKFGDVVFWSGSIINYRGQGTNYTRSAVSYIQETEKPFMFPGVRFILTGGGEPSNHMIDMGDGTIFLYSDPPDDLSARIGYKDVTVGELRYPYVKEF